MVPVALCVSMAGAAREKDAEFSPALLCHGIVRLGDALKRLPGVEDPAEAQRTEARIRRRAGAV